MKPYWQGVFPAVTTQLHEDQTLDLSGTARHLEALIESGVAGVIMCGSLGENQALDAQEKRRVVDLRGDYIALCPYAPRVPFETWVLPLLHEARFERTTVGKPGALSELARLLKRTLNRIRAVADGFHLVLHTAPNSDQPGGKTLGYWKTLDDDYHWHVEILPIVPGKVKSYTVKEVYFTPVTSETSAAKLREVAPE